MSKSSCDGHGTSPPCFHILQSPCSDDKDQTVWDIGVKSDSIRRRQFPYSKSPLRICRCFQCSRILKNLFLTRHVCGRNLQINFMSQRILIIAKDNAVRFILNRFLRSGSGISGSLWLTGLKLPAAINKRVLASQRRRQRLTQGLRLGHGCRGHRASRILGGLGYWNDLSRDNAWLAHRLQRIRRPSYSSGTPSFCRQIGQRNFINSRLPLIYNLTETPLFLRYCFNFGISIV